MSRRQGSTVLSPVQASDTARPSQGLSLGTAHRGSQADSEILLCQTSHASEKFYSECGLR